MINPWTSFLAQSEYKKTLKSFKTLQQQTANIHPHTEKSTLINCVRIRVRYHLAITKEEHVCL